MTDLSPTELARVLTKNELAEHLFITWGRLELALEAIRRFPRIVKEKGDEASRPMQSEVLSYG